MSRTKVSRTSGGAATEGRPYIISSILGAIALSLAFASINHSSAQEQQKHVDANLNLHQWGAVTLFHGLPSDHVRAIAQDNDGSLWFGTDGGLATHDGRRTQKVTAEGLPQGRVLALGLDSEGVLWVGGDSGAARLVNGVFTLIPETAGHSINSIRTYDHGAVLTGEQGDLFICSGSTQLMTRRVGPEDSSLLSLDRTKGVPLPLTSVAVTGKDTLLIGTRGRGLLVRADSGVQEVNSKPRPLLINCVERDSSDRVWFGTAAAKGEIGLYYATDIAKPRKAPGFECPVNAIHVDEPSSVWIGASGKGLFHLAAEGRGNAPRGEDELTIRVLDHFTFDNTAGGLRSNFIYSIFSDREGVIWIGTDRGVCRYDPRSPRVERVGDTAGSNFIHALCRTSDGRLWCGTNSGLFVRDAETADWRAVRGLAGKIVHSLCEDSPSRLLAGTANGLYGIDMRSGRGDEVDTLPRSDSSPNTADSVRAIRRFQGGTYAAAFGRGVERISGGERTLIWPLDRADEQARDVVSLSAESNKRLWIGTASSGLFSFDGNNVVDESPGGSLGAVWAVAGSLESGLWLGALTGLYSYKEGKLEPVLPGPDVRGLIAGGSANTLWCGTAGHGLFKVVSGGLGGVTVAKLDTEHGFPSNSIFSLYAPNSTEQSLWIGTNRGLAFYKTTMIPPLLRIARAVGSRAYQADEIQRGVRLDYPQNSIAVDVLAVSSRTFPEQFQYSFQLIDGEGAVLKTKHSSDAQFIADGLRPGSYRIEVRAYSSDLVASEPLALSFAVARAPLPRTTIGLSVLLALALVVLWWGWRQYGKLGRTNEQLAVTRLQLATETERERQRIARDLHDQTLADLRRLMLTSDRMPSDGGSQPAALRVEIEAISTEIRRICEDLSPSVLSNVGLIASLEWVLSDSVSHMPQEQKPEYKLDCEEGLEERVALGGTDKIQIYRMVQEAVSNACRHAAAKHLSIIVTAEPDGLEIRVEDDGVGFEPDKAAVETSRGLGNIKSRASLIDASVSWTAREGGGTRFTLRKRLQDRSA